MYNTNLLQHWRKTALISASILTGIVLAPLPTAFASQQSPYTYKLKQIVLNGKTVETVDSFVSSGTSYMPIWYVMQVMSRLGYTNHWDGKTWMMTLPSNFTGTVKLEQYGTGRQEIILANRAKAYVDGITATDPQSDKPTTFMPIWYVMQLVKAAGLTVSWNGTTWRMTSQSTSITTTSTASNNTNGDASATPPSVPVSSHANPFVFLMYMSGSDASIADIRQYLPNVNEVAPSGFYLNSDASIGGAPTTSSLSFANGKKIEAVPRLSSGDSSAISAVLSNATLRTKLVNNIMTIIHNYQLSGVSIDFEIVPTDQRDNFTAFLHQLYGLMHPLGEQLSVALPAVTNPSTEYWDDGYDFQGIGQNVDYAVIMAYDYSYPGGSPGPIAPVWWVNKAATYAVSQIPSNKVLLGLDVYGYDWGDSYASAWDIPSLDSQVQTNHISTQWDAPDEAPYYTYTESGVEHTVYYENAQSIAAKILVAQQQHLAGIAVWRAGLEDASIAQVLSKYTG